MKRCPDEGVWQAYMDGELASGAAREAAEHLAACERCSVALAAAEGEGTFLASAFGPDESLSVPTEQLRARISAAVARLEEQPATVERQASPWGFAALLSSFTSLFTLRPRMASGFAGLLAVVLFAAIFISIQRPTPEKQSGEKLSAGGGSTTQNTSQPNNNSENRPESAVVRPDRTPGIKRSSAVVIPAKGNRPAQPKPKAKEGVKTTPIMPKELPGEQEYQQAIASLSQVISVGGDAVLRPQARADYERSIAVLDKAIEETRRVARRNPKDTDAVEYLMSAYQSKIELMTTVADQAQVAALER